MRPVFALFLMLCFGYGVFGQTSVSGRDTIKLMNGEYITGTVTDTANFEAKILQQGKKRTKEIALEGERIFSIKFNTGFEKIYYFQDTLIGNYLTIDEAKLFIRGEQDAGKYYKATGLFIGGIIVGAASAVLTSPNNIQLLSPVPPFLYAITVMAPRIRIKPGKVSNTDFIKEESYRMGYERVIRKKRTMAALYGSLIGLAAGFTGYAILR